MSKSKRKEVKVDSSKENQQKMESLIIPLTVYQQSFISLLIYILTGVSKMDQLSELIYRALRLVESSRVRPIMYNAATTRLSMYLKLEGKLSGTSLSGRGLLAFNKYIEYLIAVSHDEFGLANLDYGDVIISLLIFLCISCRDNSKAIASEAPFVSLLCIYADEPQYVRLCVVDCNNQTVYDDRFYDIEDYFISLKSNTSQQIMKSQSSDIMDAYWKMNNRRDGYANEVYIRMDSLISDMVKTGKLEKRAWSIRKFNLFNDD